MKRAEIMELAEATKEAYRQIAKNTETLFREGTGNAPEGNDAAFAIQLHLQDSANRFQNLVTVAMLRSDESIAEIVDKAEKTGTLKVLDNGQ
jgi:hypothetical protein